MSGLGSLAQQLEAAEWQRKLMDETARVRAEIKAQREVDQADIKDSTVLPNFLPRRNIQ
jgi:hypothetical protein